MPPETAHRAAGASRRDSTTYAGSHENAPRRGSMTEHSGRFAITPARAVEDHRLGDAAYRVLACLGTYADRDGWCWPSMATLADRLGVTPKAIQRSVRQLGALRYIEV